MVRLTFGDQGPGRGFTAEWQDNEHPEMTVVHSVSIDPLTSIPDGPMVKGLAVCHVHWIHLYWPSGNGVVLGVCKEGIDVYREMEYIASACLN